MAANKHILVMEVLQTMVEGQAMHSKDMKKALGRIQWATAACPLAKSMLQPLWAWKMPTTTAGKPPKVVRMLAFMLRFLFNTPFVQYSPYLPKSSWWGCSDASASDEGLAFVGGWCSNKMEPEKKEVYWFHEQIHVEEYPWAFKNGDPKRRIAALEMLGTLFLCNMILTHQGPLSSRVRLPVGSDKQSNVMAMLNLGSKKPYTAAILMELVFLLYTHGCSLAANHVPREFNPCATAAAGWSAPWSTWCARTMPRQTESVRGKGCAVIPLQNVAADGGLELGQQVKAYDFPAFRLEDLSH